MGLPSLAILSGMLWLSGRLSSQAGEETNEFRPLITSELLTRAEGYFQKHDLSSEAVERIGKMDPLRPFRAGP